MEYACRCGAFAAEIETRGGVRVVCYCGSCRAFSEKTEATDTLDAAGGTDLYQVAPEHVRFLRGAEHLTWTRLTPKGPVRWYTTCCNSPIANTLPTRALPFATLQSYRFADVDALGPVAARVFRRYATGRAPDGGKGIGYLYRNFGWRALKSRVSGGWRRNPFFDDTGKMIAAREAGSA